MHYAAKKASAKWKQRHRHRLPEGRPRGLPPPQPFVCPSLRGRAAPGAAAGGRAARRGSNKARREREARGSPQRRWWRREGGVTGGRSSPAGIEPGCEGWRAQLLPPPPPVPSRPVPSSPLSGAGRRLAAAGAPGPSSARRLVRAAGSGGDCCAPRATSSRGLPALPASRRFRACSVAAALT